MLVQDALGAAQTCRLLFVGDSITESFRGTSYGKPCDRCKHIPGVFQKEFGELAPLTLAISGDMTQHLLWRLGNGEIPKHLHPEVSFECSEVLCDTGVPGGCGADRDE